MGEVKRYYIMESAVKPMADGAPCYTPLVNSKTDLHIVPLVLGSDYDALRAENAELVAAVLNIFEAICMDEMRDSSEGDSPQAAAMRVRRRISTWRDAALAKRRGGTTQPTDKP